MTNQARPTAKGKPAKGTASRQPDWAEGLKSIYDAVVDEPLPDDMMQLLASLDAAEGGSK